MNITPLSIWNIRLISHELLASPCPLPLSADERATKRAQHASNKIQPTPARPPAQRPPRRQPTPGRQRARQPHRAEQEQQRRPKDRHPATAQSAAQRPGFLSQRHGAGRERKLPSRRKSGPRRQELQVPEAERRAKQQQRATAEKKLAAAAKWGREEKVLCVKGLPTEQGPLPETSWQESLHQSCSSDRSCAKWPERSLCA